jgi:cytochrome P450
MIPFFAGVDTVGQTIGFLIWEVLRDPALKERIRKEADELFANGALDARALRGASDIQGAVLESLRRYPVAFAMPRYAAADFTFQGHRVQKGQALLVFTTACHFQPEYFPEPERFDIDRFRPPRDEHRRPDVFAPFGRGPHQCLGAGFAMIQLTGMLATMMHHCELALPDPTREFRPVLRPSLSMGEAFSVRFDGWRNPPPAPAG